MYFEIYKDAKGEYRWRLKAAVDLVKSTNADTPVKEV